MINRPALINDDFARLVIRDVDDFGIRGADFDRAVRFGDDLAVVGAKITGRECAAAERLGGREHGGLVRQHGFAEFPGPIEVLVHHLDDLGIVQQRDDRVVPGFVGLEIRVFLEVFEEARRTDDVERERRGRQDDAEHVVRVECHRCDEVLEQSRVEVLGAGLGADHGTGGKQ